MPFESPSQLASVGLRPAGTGPSSPFETIIKSGGQFLGSYFDQQEKEAKKAKDKLEMYITLRKAGYTSDQATDSVNKGYKFPGEAAQDVYGAQAEEEILKPEETRQKIETEKAKQKYYGEGGRITPQNKERNRLFDELEAGTIKYEDLTPAEVKLLYGHTEKTGGSSDTVNKLVAKLGAGEEDKTQKTEEGKKGGTWSWLGNFIGKSAGAMDKARAGAAKSTKPKVPTKETKIIQGVTYERGSDGKSWVKVQ